MWSIRCSRASAEVVGMPALCMMVLPSDLQAHVFDFRTNVIQSHGQLTVRCDENKARTQCQHEPFRKSGKLSRGLSYPAGLRFPPVGWHSL